MLIYHPASPEVKYAYYHSLPPMALARRPVRVFLYIHNHVPTQTYSELEARIKDDDIPTVLKLCDEYKYTLLAPVQPTVNSNITMYSDKTNADFYERPDAVVLKMVKNFLWMLKVNGYTVHQRVFAFGQSEQASFANQFSIFYPDVIQAITVGDADFYMYPTDKIHDVILSYPYGTYDILKFQPNSYSSEAFKKISHLIYDTKMLSGRLDKTEGENSTFVRNTFGNTKEERARKFTEYLSMSGMEAVYKPYETQRTNDEILREGFQFFDTIKTPTY